MKLKRKNDGSIELTTSKAILRMEGQGHMPKFKVGDKVKVVRIIDGGLTLKERYLNDILTIEKLNPNNKYLTTPADTHYGVVEKPANIFVWFEEELELVEEKEKPFTKADLKSGMVVEYRTGERALVVADRFLRFDSHMKFCDYRDGLTLIHPCTFVDDKPSYDITKVYTIKNGSPLDLHDVFRDSHIELIWERKEAKPYKEMTVAEIEEKLGHKVKIVDGE